MTDAETATAVETLTRRLRERDTAMRDGGEYADAEVFAAELMTALRGQGWRVTPAKAQPEPHEPGAGLPKRADAVELLRKAREDAEAAAAAYRNPGAA